MKKSRLIAVSLIFAFSLLVGCGGGMEVGAGGASNSTSDEPGWEELVRAINDLEVKVEKLEKDNAALQDILSMVTEHLLTAEEDIADLTGNIDINVGALANRLSTVESNNALLLDPYLTISSGTIESLAGPHVILTGANLHVRSGGGSTAAAVNGVGNLIMGYNEYLSGNRGGSHNLIVGTQHNYSSYGGFLAGYRNTVTTRYASVSGGADNTASGDYASVSGGYLNVASGVAASISGGYLNTASSYESSVSGGRENTASGDYSSVSGGEKNMASGYASSASGGRENTASDAYSSVSGGRENTVSGWYSSVSGGRENTTSGWYSSVSGGETNTTSGLYASVSGGYLNVASGFTASVSGGYQNTASASYSSVSGGWSNTASGDRSSVSGGRLNTASGIISSVSGGRQNTAIGEGSSVSGGSGKSVSDDYDWAACDVTCTP
ncbi:MAG: hypothetical protein JSU92_02980 [Deltaproteobacteria bacterium]|nr:MAG: hypothetical protein JSU92_02980 [Deltaproteobacteria bacterium]